MKFTKMHGCGNDYVYVDCTKEMIPKAEQTAVFVSDRHFGIGSDGLILIAPSQRADFEMIMFNADGSLGEMCGNGIRCVGKYVYDHGLTDQTHITVDTLAGIKNLELTVTDGKVTEALVDMGAPEFSCDRIPVVCDKETAIAEPIMVDGKTYEMTCVSMGNPHCVIFCEEDVRSLDLEKIGPSFERHERFPKRINTEFVNVLDDSHVRMRVWERGSGETLACGTGACAVAAAAVSNHLTKPSVDVELLGGHLLITWDEKKNLIWMKGPAVTVFEGEIELPWDRQS